MKNYIHPKVGRTCSTMHESKQVALFNEVGLCSFITLEFNYHFDVMEVMNVQTSLS